MPAQISLDTTLHARYASSMKLSLGGDGQHGPFLQHITDAAWDQFTEQEKQQRWLAFGGENAAVWVRLDVRDGRTVITGLLALDGADPIDVAALRSIPLGQLRDLAAQFADDAMRAAVPAAQLEGVQALPKKSPGRVGHSQEALQRVAVAWSQALRTHSRAPMKETARILGYSLAQTRRLVRRVQADDLINVVAIEPVVPNQTTSNTEGS
jgi:hypothetical protein